MAMNVMDGNVVTNNKLTLPAVVDAENPGALPCGVVDDDDDLSQRANWLRAAVLGANDGLVSTASLMLGVGAVKADARAMVISGFAGLLAGACSMAIGEFVSVCSQRDVELAQLDRDGKRGGQEEKALPSPVQAAAASALAFSVGALVPLLAAGFIRDYRLRVGVVIALATATLAAFGCVGAVLGRAPVVRSCARVVFGGWVAMGVTFGLMRLFKATGI
ncbi:Vacuolar iron transporter-like protein 5 [Dichanthelium oligosanthes]|uniref:Vacuolar iron transporter n=1 Tax=Dichanthelium oligosanthes TaxID=888268 RepID=A0A1E5W7Y4_9POAL|nr:Vacuolar iron transporter-like protein 5 [Dichanthelium oligosanthes]